MGTFKVWQYRRQWTRLIIWFTTFNTDISAAPGRNYVCRVAPINCNFSGPAERVRLMIHRLIGNYPARQRVPPQVGKELPGQKQYVIVPYFIEFLTSIMQSKCYSIFNHCTSDSWNYENSFFQILMLVRHINWPVLSFFTFGI